MTVFHEVIGRGHFTQPDNTPIPTRTANQHILHNMPTFLRILMAAMITAAPASTVHESTLSSNLTRVEFAAAHELLYPMTSAIQDHDDGSPCNWVKCSYSDITVWSATCRWDPRPASLCAVCTCKYFGSIWIVRSC
jgi:hypothetical protein